MPFAELLRTSVFLAAGGATALGAVAVVGASQEYNPTLLVIGGLWWLAAGIIGLRGGSAERAAADLRDVLASARSVSPDMPSPGVASPAKIGWSRLWPIPAVVILAGGLGVLIPEIPAIAAGYALMVALSWRNRESAVLAIEGRDGVRFLVESARPFSRPKLIRVPGFKVF